MVWFNVTWGEPRLCFFSQPAVSCIVCTHSQDDLDVDETDLDTERVQFVRPMTQLEWQVQKALQKHGGKSKFAQLAKVEC